MVVMPLAAQEGAVEIQKSQALLDQIITGSQKHAYQRQTAAGHPLRVAESIAAGAAGDLSEYNDLMVGIVTRWAKAGEITEATYLADNLPASGPARAFLEIAAELLQAGRKSEAEVPMTRALESIGQARGRKLELLQTRRAELLYKLGHREEAAKIEASLSELGQLEIATRVQSLPDSPLLDLAQAMKRMERCEDRGVDRIRAAFLIACADHQYREKHPEAGLAMLQEAGRLATRDGLPSAQEVLVDLARTAHAHGEVKEAEKATRVQLEIIKGYANAASWKAPSLASVLDLLVTWGGHDKLVADWLKAGEQSLAEVFIMDAPRSMLALARIAERVKGPAEGDRLALAAAKAARTHPHPRAQASAGVLVCLYYADLGRAIPAEILKVINPQQEAAAN